jgi:hypothetical protein
MSVAEKYQHYPAIGTPATCPKCGSTDLTYPYQGRRTGLWLATCRDCDTRVRSTIQFEITPRRRARRGTFVLEPDPQPTRPIGTMLMAAAIRAGEPLQTEWLPYREREPGEEG